jgi:SAM-dependent methyltransferase
VPYEDALKRTQALVDDIANGTPKLRVLDAGCGTQNYLRFDRPVHVTGIDISAAQLEKNPELSERIVGDLQTYELPVMAYDVVVCWDVLEHLKDPRSALIRLANAVAPGGILVVGSPNPASLKGMVTRLTPYKFHVWVYRRFFNDGDGGNPFPTYMRREGGAPSVTAVGTARGLSAELLVYWESMMQIHLRHRLRVPDGAWNAARSLVRVVTAGRLDLVRTDFICVMRRDLDQQ